jgi:hypothetical protein
MRAIAVGLAVVLFAGAAATAAGEPPPEPAKRGQTPAERADSLLRSLKAPDPADDFVFECELRSADSVVGEGLFEARAGSADGRPVWVVTEEARIPQGPVTQTRLTRAQLTQDLRLLRIEKEDVTPPRAKTSVSAERSPAGFSITEPRPATEGPRKATIEAPPSTTSTFGALAQFLRKCPSEPATYEIPYFNLARERVTTAKIVVKGPGSLEVEGRLVSAWVAAVDPDPDLHLDFYFDPTGRGLLAMVLPERGLTFAKKGLFAHRAPPPIDATKPPSSAKDAGVRLTVGLLSGDLDLAKGAIDFTAMRTIEDYKGPLDEFTSKFVVQRLQPMMKKVARPQAEAFARAGLVGAIEITKPDGTVSIAFGPSLPNVRYEARGKDGVWRIVRLTE